MSDRLILHISSESKLNVPSSRRLARVHVPVVHASFCLLSRIRLPSGVFQVLQDLLGSRLISKESFLLDPPLLSSPPPLFSSLSTCSLAASRSRTLSPSPAPSLEPAKGDEVEAQGQRSGKHLLEPVQVAAGVREVVVLPREAETRREEEREIVTTESCPTASSMEFKTFSCAYRSARDLEDLG